MGQLKVVVVKTTRKRITYNKMFDPVITYHRIKLDIHVTQMFTHTGQRFHEYDVGSCQINPNQSTVGLKTTIPKKFPPKLE